jgi:hypothetical protein
MMHHLKVWRGPVCVSMSRLRTLHGAIFVFFHERVFRTASVYPWFTPFNRVRVEGISRLLASY